MISSQRKWSGLLAVAVLLSILSVGYLYWAKIMPVKNDIGDLKRSISEEEHLIENLGGTKQNQKAIDISQTRDLQIKLPVEELEDQFILDLERAEVASGSLIKSMSFGDEAKQDTEPLMDENGQISGQEQTSPQKEVPSKKADIPLLEGVKKLTIEINAESDTYDELEKFIKEIEKLPRITRIENLMLTGPQEDQLQNNMNKLQYTFTASAFYYAELKDLKEGLPKLDSPPPGSKENPLLPIEPERAPAAGAVTEPESGQVSGPETASLTDAQSKNVEKDGKEYEVFTYTVQPADTLFSLAVHYYNSRSGEEMIKSWNNIKELKYGTVIEIPVPVDAVNDES